jgi:hypothetical protein
MFSALTPLTCVRAELPKREVEQMSDSQRKDPHAPIQPDDDANTDREARRATLRRMSWKFLVVGVALLAYAGLRGLEGAKHSYDEERGRPLVLVDDGYAEQVRAALDNLKRGVAPRDGSERLRYDAVLLKKGDVVGVLDAKRPAGVFDEETVRGVGEAVARVGYQSFKGAKELLDRLDEEILDGADNEKKSLMAAEEAESRAQASKLPEFSQEKGEVRNALTDRYREANGLPQQQTPTAGQLDAWLGEQLKDLKRPPATDKEIERWRKDLGAPNKRLPDEQLLRWQAAINRRNTNEELRQKSRLQEVKTKISDIDERAQRQVSAIYTVLKPELPRLIRDGVNAPDGGGSALVSFFSPRAVLDEENGIHVVYQTLRLTFVVVLVFAVLFVVMLLLRPMPFFASGTDALLEQAGGLFGGEGRGGAPQVAKSIAMTAAALGVGAAVAVAGSTAVGDGKRRGGGGGGSGDPVEQGRDGRDGQVGARGQRGLAGRRGEDGVVEHVVTLAEPIVYPSPITVNVPQPSVTFDTTRLGTLEAELGRIKAATDTTLPGVDERLDVRLKSVEQDAAVLRQVDVKKLYTDVGLIDGRLTGAETELKDYVQWKTTVTQQFAEAIGRFQEQLGETNSAVAELRDNSFERLQNSGGRSLPTRALQVFKRDRYLVTDLSVRALRSVMSRPASACPTPDGTPPDPKKKCCGGTPTGAAFCYATDVEPLLLARLSALIGKPPMKDSDLRAALLGNKVTGADLNPWESVIRKYTRMAY